MKTPKVAYGVPITSIVGDGFCGPYPVELIIKKKYVGFFSPRYQVLDVNGKVLLQVNGSCRNFRKKLIMRDAAGLLILSMRKKVCSILHGWTVHRGKSSKPDDLLFGLQRPHPFQFKPRMDVFLSSNIHEHISNFKIAGGCCCPSMSSKVYMGDSVIAEAKHSFKWRNFFRGRNNIRVKVNSTVDYAFIVALIVIRNETDEKCLF